MFCARAAAGILAVVGFPYRIGKGIAGVRARQHLLHLKLRSRTAGDHRLGPLLDRFTWSRPDGYELETRRLYGALYRRNVGVDILNFRETEDGSWGLGAPDQP